MKQRLALVCALGLCAAMISACPPPAPVTGPGSGTGDGAGGGGSSDDDDCPSAPEGITSSIDAVSRLGRAVREARANLMVRVARAVRPARGQAPSARAPIFATLHHPLLAFAEAALAAPKKARDADKAWLQRSIGHAYVELRSREPIALDGDLDRITLRLAGRQHAALLLTVRRGDSGYVYRISFAPFVMGDDVGLSKIHLALPDGSVARWGLSARNVQSLGGRPFVYGLMPALWDRHVRRALLRGDMARAVARYDVLKRCAADEAQTKALAALMARLPKGAPAATPPAKGADAPQK
ncbi:MAG: hypothetical protein KC503_35505, partial [Myxococcales bacterium]|nr:hypothetical protein [Myxococcales bacterium]